jgi:hypothetical protein
MRGDLWLEVEHHKCWPLRALQWVARERLDHGPIGPGRSHA